MESGKNLWREASFYRTAKVKAVDIIKGENIMQQPQLLVVIAIIAILIGLLLPAVQNVR